MSEWIITTEQLNFFLAHMDENILIPAEIAHLKPIVRCRDCVHFCIANKKYPDSCKLWLPRNLSKQYGITPDGFCAWGERRQSAD